MKKLLLILTAVLMLAVGGCAPQVDIEAERAAVHRFHDECLIAQLSGNVDCFAEDGQWLPPDAPPINGKAAIGELVSQAIQDPNFSVSHDIVDIEISGSGDLAYIHYTYAFTMSDPDGNPVTERGKAVHLLKKVPEIGWKILIDIWNTDPVSVEAYAMDQEQIEVDTQAIWKIIEDHNANLTKWYAEGAIDKAAEVFAEDCWQMPPNRPPVVGREAFRENWRQSVQLGKWNFEFDVQEVVVSGNIAVERSKYELEFTAGPDAPSNMPSYKDKGNYVVMWRQENDGEWRIVWDAPVSELPVPGPQ